MAAAQTQDRKLSPDKPLTEHAPATVSHEMALTSSMRSLSMQLSPSDVALTAVVFHAACAEHKFIRKTTDDTFERPDRLLAIREAVNYLQAISNNSLSVVECSRTVPFGDPHILAVHGEEFLRNLTTWSMESAARLAQHKVELPSHLPVDDLYLCPGSVSAMQGALGAVFDAIDIVCKRTEKIATTNHGRSAFAAIRPPGHHAKCASPSGFCFINNVMCGALYAFNIHNISRIAIIDFDLHHGDGTQEIVRKFASQRGSRSKPLRPRVFYGSLHDIRSFPTETYDEQKVNEASICLMDHGHYIWNVHLEPYKTLADFDQLYNSKYLQLIQQAQRFFVAGKPSECLLIVSAGFDAHEKEYPQMQRHGSRVPDRFYHRFTRDLVKLANDHCMGRLVSVLEGGYSREALLNGACGHIGALMGFTEAEAKYTSRRSSPAAALSQAQPSTRVQTRASKASTSGTSGSPISQQSPLPVSSSLSPTSATGSVISPVHSTSSPIIADIRMNINTIISPDVNTMHRFEPFLDPSSASPTSSSMFKKTSE